MVQRGEMATKPRTKTGCLILTLVAPTGVLVVWFAGVYLVNAYCGAGVYMAPEFEDVAWARAQFIQHDDGWKEVEFEVPRENVRQILAAENAL